MEINTTENDVQKAFPGFGEFTGTFVSDFVYEVHDLTHDGVSSFNDLSEARGEVDRLISSGRKWEFRKVQRWHVGDETISIVRESQKPLHQQTQEVFNED